MTNELTDAEKHKFLNSLHWDTRFRQEIVERIISEGDIQKEVEMAINRESIIDSVTSDLYYEVCGEVQSMAKQEVSSKIKDIVNDEELAKLKNDIIKKIRVKEGDIIKEVTERVVRSCLCNIGDKEELREKVQQIMIKKRSYRSDLIDLSDD